MRYSNITGYEIERRDLMGGRWVSITSKPVSGTEYKDTNVEKDHQYEYKVKAFNAAGGGPYSDPSLSITAKPMKSPPKLDLDVLNQRIRVKAGEEIHVLIPFVGTPLPYVEWSKDGRSVLSKRFACEVKHSEQAPAIHRYNGSTLSNSFVFNFVERDSECPKDVSIPL